MQQVTAHLSWQLAPTNLRQPILPNWQFHLFNENLGTSAHPSVEQAALEKVGGCDCPIKHLAEAQELITQEIRRLCLLPLDDPASVAREFLNAAASRAGISRLLRRKALSKLADLQPLQEGEDAPKKTFF